MVCLNRKNYIATALLGLSMLAGPAHAYSDAALIDGFNKTVFGTEHYRFAIGNLLGGSYVHKFEGPVRFHIRGDGSKARKAQVRRFLQQIDRLIEGLDVRMAEDEASANFVVHVVTRAAYRDTVLDEVFRSPTAAIPGKCMVRSMFDRSGISRSDAVIVTDEGDELFSRCMTEEILQGLGPLNDDRSLAASMFNDTSNHTSFRRFDRLLLNMLYDRRIKSGDSRAKVLKALPQIVRDVKRRIARAD